MKFILFALAAYLVSPQTSQEISEQAVIHEINAQICSNALNTVWEHEYDCNFGPEPRTNQDVIRAIQRFKNGDCYGNPHLKQSNEQLLKKEADKINKHLNK